MKKILTLEQAVKISKQLQRAGKKIVLAGGCFDILHVGHVTFLQEAKKQADSLFVLLESDSGIKDIKGKDRPIHTQKDRALVLAALDAVDYVVVLPTLKKNKEYDDLLCKIKPTIIATTKGDPYRKHKERQAKLVGGKVVDVVKRIANLSTSTLAKLLSSDYLL